MGGYGISYELNISGLSVLKYKGLLDSYFYEDNEIIRTEKLIRKEFSLRQFEPRTKSSELRKYRYIQSKPRTVAYAGNWMLNECGWNLYDWLNGNEHNLREKLCDCPGIGMKSASWFLRNTGYNDDYAVFDIHVLRFLSKIGFDVPEKK